MYTSMLIWVNILLHYSTGVKFKFIWYWWKWSLIRNKFYCIWIVYIFKVIIPNQVAVRLFACLGMSGVWRLGHHSGMYSSLWYYVVSQTRKLHTTSTSSTLQPTVCHLLWHHASVILWQWSVGLAGVTLKSDPVEKWLPGSFFNGKNDSPGHFSTLKADTGQILTLNFEPKVFKKLLPPWNFDLQGGHFSTISPHWK